MPIGKLEHDQAAVFFVRSANALEKELQRAVKSLRKIVRLYVSPPGAGDGRVSGHRAPVIGLRPLPAIHKHMHRILRPVPQQSRSAVPRALQRRTTPPLLSFAAVPVRHASNAHHKSHPEITHAQVDASSAWPTSPSSSQPDHASVAESIVWGTHILHALSELRMAYEQLTGDPLWQLAVLGSKLGGRKYGPGKTEHSSLGDFEVLDAEDAVFELAQMEVLSAGRHRAVHSSPQMDPMQALLEFAQLGGSGSF